MDLADKENTRQDLSLQLQAMSNGYKIENGQIKRDYTKPEIKSVSNKDGSTTIWQIPYNPDGSINMGGASSMTVDSHGNVIATEGVGSPATPSPAGSPVVQQNGVVTDAEHTRIKNDNDINAFATITDNAGTVTINRVTGKDADRVTAVRKSRRNNKYAKLVKVDPNNIPPSLTATYQNAKNAFLSDSSDGGKHNLNNYDVYVSQDFEHPDRPATFMFASKITNMSKFNVATQAEADGINMARKVIAEAAAQEHKLSQAAIDKAYRMGKEGKRVTYKPQNIYPSNVVPAPQGDQESVIEDTTLRNAYTGKDFQF